MEDQREMKPLYQKKWLIMLVLLIVIGAFASAGGKHASKTANVQTPAPVSPPPSTAASPEVSATISVKMRLISGNYTVGVDFPAGVYTITAISGKGNVYSSNMHSGGINAAMGTQDINTKLGAKIYQQNHSDVQLRSGDVLSVSGGVVIELTCEKADSTPLKSRNQSITDNVYLVGGTYIAGEDFPAGTYDVIAVSGSGNVHSGNMYSGGINAAMGTEEENKAAGIDLYEQRYNHIEFPAGTTLVVSKVDISLVPSA